MFLKVQHKKAKDGSIHLYASVVENKRAGKKTVQRTVVSIGRIEKDQVPYLRAAWSSEKPRLTWD